MSDSPAKYRQVLKDVIDGNLSKAKASKKLGVSRKTIYKWLQVYKVNPSGWNRTRKTSKRNNCKKHILSLIVANPKLGPKKISRELNKRGIKLSTKSVWLVLKSMGLQKSVDRENYSYNFRKPKQAKDNEYPFYLRLSSEARKRVVEGVRASEKRVSEVTHEFNISRKTYAKWKKRYLTAHQEGTNLLKALSDNHPTGSKHPRGTNEKVERAILTLVIEYPELSSHKIAEKLGYIGNHGVQGVLARNNLSRYEMRRAYSEAQRTVPRPVPAISTGFLNRVRTVLEQFIPSLAPVPPPRSVYMNVARLFKVFRLKELPRFKPFFKPFFTSTLFIFITVFTFV